MLQGEHSAILSIFIKLPFVNKIFLLSIFEWPLKTCFTVHAIDKGSGADSPEPALLVNAISIKILM